MMFLTTHEKFIITALPTEENPDKDFTPIEFFAKFKFLNRDSAEEAFKNAVNRLCKSDNITKDQQVYLTVSFLDNDFADLETVPLNTYWRIIEKDFR